jgi:hypothetical protein
MYIRGTRWENSLRKNTLHLPDRMFFIEGSDDG